LVVVFDE
jgi:hypothetical protein